MNDSIKNQLSQFLDKSTPIIAHYNAANRILNYSKGASRQLVTDFSVYLENSLLS